MKAKIFLLVIATAALTVGCRRRAPQPTTPPYQAPQAYPAPQQGQPVAQPVQQQPMQPQPQQPMAAQANFERGFLPDPAVMQGYAGGPVDARQLDPSCRGFIGQSPNHTFSTQSGFGFLRVYTEATEDTTLVIQTPTGQFLCDDDGGQGQNAQIANQFGPGTYAVFVGTYRQGAQAPYQLNISERQQGGQGGPAPTNPNIQQPPPPQQPPQQGQGASNTQDGNSNFGTVTLIPNFQPDPFMVAGSSGGAGGGQNGVNANTLDPSCRGTIDATPDHILNVPQGMPFLKVMVASQGDTTLVVRAPNGMVLCDDDTEGRNPVVSGSFGPGVYEVYVGSYSASANHDYRIGFTELERMTTQNM